MRAFSCLQDKHEICRRASPVIVSQPPGPLSRRLWKMHTLSYVVHTHSLREPAGGGSGQTKPREQSEAGGSYPHRDATWGRPLEKLFGSAGVCKAGSWYRCQKLFFRDVQIWVLRRSLWVPSSCFWCVCVCVCVCVVLKCTKKVIRSLRANPSFTPHQQCDPEQVLAYLWLSLLDSKYIQFLEHSDYSISVSYYSPQGMLTLSVSIF